MRENAFLCGMTEKEFRHSTLSEINLRLKRYKEEKEYKAKEIEHQAWLSGVFVMNAINCCFSKNAKYPENPLAKINGSIEEMAKQTGKSEEELIQEEQYFAMRIRQANANIAKTLKKKGEE